MATIKDVAQLAGVALSTVSLAFSNPGRVAKPTLERVRRAAATLGYSASPVARTLATGKSRMVGLVVGDLGNPFFSEMRSEIERYALSRGYFVIMSDSGDQEVRERELLGFMAGNRVAGLVLTPSGKDESYQAFIGSLTMPIVQFDRKAVGLACDYVGTENKLASTILAEHLLHLGHRRIAFLGGGAGTNVGEDRTAGFLATMAAAQIEVDPSQVVDGGFDHEVAYSATIRLLATRDRPTAIIGASNVMALSALQAIRDLGLSCPGDISLAMIDDVPWSQLIEPKLTKVVQDTEQMARIVVDRLFQRMLSPEAAAGPPQDFIVPPRFFPGTSCAAV